MSDLKKRLMKASTNKLTAGLEKSSFFNDRDMVKTNVPMLNLALSGRFDGGLPSGLGLLAGPSKSFKTCMGLVMVAAYLKKYPDAICLFYDSEFGCTPAYLKSMGVDPDRVVHTPIQNIEGLKCDLVNQLEAINRGEKVIVFIDSVGNTASKKETDDALNEKLVADMSRAKAIKSLFRIATPYFTTKDIPCVAICHTYETQEMYSKSIISGGTGLMYSANWAFIIGKRQIKEDKDIVGYEFVINAEKSRYVKEKSKFPISVTFDGGINMYSGLLELAQELGFVVKPSVGWFQPAFLDIETGEMVPDESKKWRAKDTECLEFWKPLFAHEHFKQAVRNRYELGAIELDSEAMEEEVAQLI